MSFEPTASSRGEDNLDTLLASLQPQLDAAVYVFCVMPLNKPVPDDIQPICQFAESEGMTLILEQTQADEAGLDSIYPCRRIILTVHSDLAAVGLLATVTQMLATAGISVNAISAYYHDHLFVPCDRANDAMACLQTLTSNSQPV